MQLLLEKEDGELQKKQDLQKYQQLLEMMMIEKIKKFL